MAKIIKLKESDLENIVKRVLAEQGEVEMDMDMEVSDEEEGDAIEITLDHIAMLLKDGECDCGGQKLVLNLSGSDEGEEMDIETDYDEELMESKRKVRVMENRLRRKKQMRRR